MAITLDGSEGISLEVIVAAGCCQHEAVTRLRCELGEKLRTHKLLEDGTTQCSKELSELETSICYLEGRL